MHAGLNILVSFVLDAFMGELEADKDSEGDKEDSGCGPLDSGGPGFGSPGHAIQVVDGSVLADSTDVQGVQLALQRHLIYKPVLVKGRSPNRITLLNL